MGRPGHGHKSATDWFGWKNRPVATDANPAGSTRDDEIRVVFVCWGNICRSPMAERVAERVAADAGLAGVRFTSAATSTEELGAPIDHRAVRTLAAAGYRTGDHHAHQITAAEAHDADLVIAMENLHLDRIRRIAGDTGNLSLLSDHDPDAVPGSGVPDPWYGGQDGFDDTLAMIESAIPGVLDEVRRLSDGSGSGPGREGTSPAGS